MIKYWCRYGNLIFSENLKPRGPFAAKIALKQLFYIIKNKIKKNAKIRNRYSQVPHLTSEVAKSLISIIYLILTHVVYIANAKNVLYQTIMSQF